MFSATASWWHHQLYSRNRAGELTYDGGGFDGFHDLLQGLQVRVVVGKLLLLVVYMTSSLKLFKTVSFIKLHMGLLGYL